MDLILVALTFTSSSAQSSLVDPFTTAHNPCEHVRNGQFICLDCATLGFCAQRNGVWTTLTIGTCKTDQHLYCDEQAHGCIFQKTCKSQSRGHKFECQNAGIYPDPYDCRYYHKCGENKEAESEICPNGAAYYPATKSCSITVNHELCVRPQYNCTTTGQTGAWPTDAKIFYVCLGERPILYNCQSGYSFVNGKCNKNSTPEMTCVNEHSSLPNSDDCRSYYMCTDGILIKTTCPNGSYYNSYRKTCVFGSC
ncbi:uncharacterized protein LOC135955389 [Calliphora vicina]|uniref:uncharacterized protein LOC135955389 n=1 Tax=Calliphora vicina TaxID=7373 RepID=UPI00325B29C0